MPLMDTVAHVTVHESEFPGANANLLRDGLTRRDLSQKFLYQSPGQTARWLALHRSYSPAVLDPECVRIYEEAFSTAAAHSREPVSHVVSLGCGGGQKDVRLLLALRGAGKTVIYTPADTSLAMVLTAQSEATRTLRGLQCQPLVMDLPSCTTLPALLKTFDPAGSERVLGLFGVFHTFEPQDVLPRLTNSVRSQDLLLVSANLAPEGRYDQAMERILPQYDNELTKAWLMGALVELGFNRADGELKVAIESGENGLKRFVAGFELKSDRHLEVADQKFHFTAGEVIRLFFSYRYTPTAVKETLGRFELDVIESWISPSQEEGVFLCRRQRGS